MQLESSVLGHAGRTSSVIDVDDEPFIHEIEDVPDDTGQLATGAASFQSDDDLQAALAASLRTGDCLLKVQRTCVLHMERYK